MSGHSHFHNIKLKKGAEDAKRSKLFSKLSKEISVAVKDGGTDVAFNPKLRSIVDKAKGLNMPNDSIDKAIKRGSGELEGVTFEEFLMEAYGPDNMALLIEGITDNKNRSINEIKLIISQKGGKMVNEGAIKWMFERRGVIGITEIQSKEDAELLVIEAGAEDILWEEDNLIVYTKPEEMEQVKKELESFKIDFANLEWVAKEKISVDEERCNSFIEAIEDHDDVSNVYTNI
ncbi:MAG: YebC/PmpR family DNA-binding transcriptional regulator [Candidatus Pacebacteria bacterium]|nr:YebC/PmpR family DNA-binding transcriptional regulator [Candidatus Paceibacterota bacterium]MDD2757133.1 YebC/PmpR family DNA-binding transcriptional regulator [Candidatus Paceibacterota bacterium]MDD3283596.1 YebC/PmpR family DNA-binding transcriptional regulator [Candidatus Paceibacterota bacterium]MDD3969781.1 YebC/PmpR family DNA-binding transcriptional regulator [Candidatus Paceibacterota bacterium]MDD4737991.1 YebC/PmpR family DNA-binding transcriptional regulator [Candidatus Paceibact